MDLLVGRSKSSFRNPFQTTVTFDIQNVDGYSWDFRDNDQTPVIHYPFDVNSASAWQWVSSPPANSTGSEIRIRPLGGSNSFQTGALALTFIGNEHVTFKGGLNRKEYSFNSFEFRRPSETVVPALPPGTTLADISLALTGFGSGLGMPPGNASGWLIPDLNAIAALFNIYCNCNTGVPGGDFTMSSVTNGNARGNNRSVREVDTGGFLQMDFDVDMLGRPLRGNLGVRYAETWIRATGYLATGGGLRVDVENEYDDWLPSVNLAWDVHDDVVLRFGAAKVMARPQLQNLSPGGTVNTTLRTVTVGNPLLEPFRATTYDVSGEWYFAEDSLFSVALFYKDIDSYIQNLRETRPWSTTGLPDSLLPPGMPNDTPFEITSSVNTPGGPLKGYEVNYQQAFKFLPGFWANFGVLLNYTHVESEIDYAVSPTSSVYVTNDLVNLSPDAWNATLYYENEAFSARVSGSYRDDYLQRVPGQNNNDVEGKRSTMNIDFSATWNLSDKLSLTLEGINLTDEFNHQFVDSVGDRTSVYHHTGRQFFAGFRYQF
jgi:TonB-dependent receptor